MSANIHRGRHYPEDDGSSRTMFARLYYFPAAGEVQLRRPRSGASHREQKVATSTGQCTHCFVHITREALMGSVDVMFGAESVLVDCLGETVLTTGNP